MYRSCNFIIHVEHTRIAETRVGSATQRAFAKEAVVTFHPLSPVSA